MNSASLRFIPVDKLESEGYGQYLAQFKAAGVADAEHDREYHGEYQRQRHPEHHVGAVSDQVPEEQPPAQIEPAHSNRRIDRRALNCALNLRSSNRRRRSFRAA